MPCFPVLETSKTHPKSLLFPHQCDIGPLLLITTSWLTGARSLLVDGAWGHASLSEQFCPDPGRFWVKHLHQLCSTLSTAPHTIDTTCLSCVPHLCPPALVMERWPRSSFSPWWYEEARQLFTKTSQHSAADEQLASWLLLPQAEAETKWFDFQRAAGIYRGGCERTTSWNWRQMLPCAKICPCKSLSHQMWLGVLKRLQFSSVDPTLASTPSPSYKLLTHSSDWHTVNAELDRTSRQETH